MVHQKSKKHNPSPKIKEKGLIKGALGASALSVWGLSLSFGHECDLHPSQRIGSSLVGYVIWILGVSVTWESPPHACG